MRDIDFTALQWSRGLIYQSLLTVQDNALKSSDFLCIISGDLLMQIWYY
jgi:hypothetical protein